MRPNPVEATAPVIAKGAVFSPPQRSSDKFQRRIIGQDPHDLCFADLVLCELPEKLHAPTPNVNIPAQITLMPSLLASVPAAVQKRCQSCMGTREK